MIWEPVSDIEVEHRIKTDVNNAVIRTLIKCLKVSKKKMTLTEGQNHMLSNLLKTEAYLSKAGNVTSPSKTGKQLFLDEGLPDKLDRNRDILAVANGVVQPGALRHPLRPPVPQRGHRGLDHPTPEVDAFFASIFNDDPQVIAYVRSWVTGHTSEQVWAVWTGVGANGKSLLLDCLSNLLGPEMYCTPAKEVFFQVPYDPDNPHHRLKDPHLRQKMATGPNREQLLVWLVRGAVQWYAQGLGEQPELLKGALQRYINDNDVLHQFIHEHCTITHLGMVKESEFNHRFMGATGTKAKCREMKEMMRKRGFSYHNLKGVGRVYKGLSFHQS